MGHLLPTATSDAPWPSLLEQLPVAVVVVDADGYIRQWNAEATRLFGWTADEVLGASWTILVSPHARESVSRVIERVLAGATVSHVNANRTKDGRTVVCEWRNAPWRDWQGKIGGVVAVAHSVVANGTTSHVLGQLLQTAPIGIALVAPDGFPLFVNKQLCDILGRAEEELQRHRFTAFLHPDDKAEDERLFQALLRGERDSYCLRQRYLRPEGTTITALLNSAVVRDDRARPLFAIRTLQDITRQVAAETEAMRRLKELDARNRILSALITTFDLQERLSRILDETLAVVGADIGGVYLREGATVRLQVSRGLSPHAVEALATFTLTDAPDWLGVQGHAPVDTVPEPLRRDGAQAWFCLPLALPTNDWIGALFIATRHRPALAPEDVAFLQDIALQLTVAVRGVWVYRQAQERLRWLESLLRINRTVVQTLDTDAVLRVVLTEAQQLLRCDLVAITLVDEETPHFTRFLGCRQDGTVVTEPLFDIDTQLVDQLVRQRLTVVLPEGTDAVRFPERDCLAPSMRYIGLPMVAGERVVGVLHLFVSAAHTFTDRDMALAQTLAGQAAIATEHLRLFELSKAWREALERFLAAQTQIARIPSSEVASVVLRTLQTSLGVTCAYFYGYDERTQTLQLKGCLLSEELAPPLADKPFAVVPLGEGLIGRVAQERRALYVADTTTEGVGSELTPHDAAPVLSVYALPLTFGDRLFGVVALLGHEPHAFSRASRALADSFAVYASAALEVSHLLEELRHHAARLEVLHRVAKAATERLDSASIARVTVETLDALMPDTMRALFVYDPNAEAFTLIAANADAEPVLRALGIAPGDSVSLSEMPFADALRRGECVCVHDVADTDLPFAGALVAVGCRSLLLQGIRSGDEFLGVIVKGRSEPHAFDERDRTFVRGLSEYLAVAFHNAALFTALQRACEDLQQAHLTIAQQERLRALGQMASGIVHDVNNALVPVIAYAEMLQEHDDPQVQQMATQMQSAVDDLVHIVNRLRAFYRPRNPHEELEPIDLNKIVQQVVDLTKPRWYDMPQREGVTIDLRLALDETLPPIAGISSEVREALTNLIFNAVDAIMDKGVPHGTIILRTGRRDDHWVFVEVSDTGVGMDEETRHRALEPFFTTKGERGTGMGLAMVYGVMERHDGSIHIDSTLGVGTTVRLLFPTRTVQDRVQATPSEMTLPPLRILVVDDDPAVRIALAAILHQLGHQVVTASDGDSAAALFESALERGAPFDVVITDLGMPRMSGTDLVRRIKKHSNTPVIVMTGWGVDAQPKGADAAIAKPVRLRELKETLVRVLAPRQA